MPSAPATSRRGIASRPSTPQVTAAAAATPTTSARVPRERERERDAREEHEPVRGRHEHRQVVQPVGVEAPDQRAGDLADRREHDHAERLRPPLAPGSASATRSARPTSARRARAAPGSSRSGRPRAAPRCRRRPPPRRAGASPSRSAAARAARERRGRQRPPRRRPASTPRYCSSCHDGTGASSRSGRPPPGCWYANSASTSSQTISSAPRLTWWSSQAPRKTSLRSQ